MGSIANSFRVWLLVVAACCVALSGRADEVLPGLALAQSERVYIANIEQQALALSRKGFPALNAAIKSGDTAEMRKFFSESFSGQPLSLSGSPTLERGNLKVYRISSEGSNPATSVKANADQFATYLTSLRNRFSKEAKVELKLTSFSPLKRNELDKGWKGAAVFRIVGTRNASHRAELIADLEFQLLRMPDIDDIETSTGWIQSIRVARLQDTASPGFLFKDVTDEVGLGKANLYDNWNQPTDKRHISTGGLYVADLDNDGNDDLFIPDINGLNLYKGSDTGHFTNVTASSGLPANARGVSFSCAGDFDNDGLIDLIVSRRPFKNMGGMRFADFAGNSNLRIGDGVTGYTLVDYDRDGKLDLYVSRNYSVSAQTATNSWIDGPGGPGNELWRNLGDWKFQNVSKTANATAGHRSVFTSAWLDANDDRWPDVYVINEFGGGVLLVNNQDGTFREQPLIDDVGDFGSMGMAVGDYNGDGRIDIYTCNMYSKAGRRIFENLSPGTYPPETFAKIKRFVTGSELYRNDGDLKFSRVGKSAGIHAVGWAYGATLFDMDNDGLLDIYATAGFMSVTKEEPDG